ncbi:MAG: MFS transporter [Chloroflexota bacterium]|nr:MFS transporter [Chloroflexota bacterium]
MAVAGPPPQDSDIMTVEEPTPSATVGNRPGLRLGRLSGNPDFMRMWAGETISMFGSQVTYIAIPLTAALVLHAEPGEMGVLHAAGFAPFLLLTLFAGVWVDRKRRRPILIFTNAGRAVLLALVPLSALFGWLSMPQLYVISLLVGSLTVFFELAYQSYLPTLVSKEELVEGNSKLQMSASMSSIGGPGIAGLLLEVLSAPFALLADAVSFLVSAVMMLRIRTPEPQPQRPHAKGNFRREIGEGISIVFKNAYLRVFALEAASYNFFWNLIEAVYILYAVRELGASPLVIGLVFSLGSIGSLLGALVAARWADRFGVGRAITVSMAISCVSTLLIPLAGDGVLGPWLVGAAFFIGGLGVTASVVHVVSLRQTVTPGHLLGRMNGSYRFITWGVIPIGALLGGFLGEVIGLRAALVVGAAGMSLSWLWVLFSPVPSLRKLSDLEPPTQEQPRHEEDSSLVEIAA